MCIVKKVEGARAKVEGSLRCARAMYISHKQTNFRQDRALCLKFWADECLKLRAELKRVSA